MSKLLVLIFFFYGYAHSYAQNNILRGVVKVQSSGSQPLSDVKISAFGAGSVFSNSNGMFELAFSGKGPGASLSLFVEKDGYELINDKELEDCVLRDDPDDLVMIIMAKQGERNKQALAYYNIIIESTNSNYKKQLKNIHNRLDALDEDDKSRRLLREQIDKLQEEKETLLNRAEGLAKQLASVDLDRASIIAQEAYEQFKSGDIKSALIILDDETLDQNYQEAVAENTKLKDRLMKSDSALAQSIENYMIKARFCTSDRQYDEAYNNYLKAIEADSTIVKNLVEAGDYCNNMRQQKRAIKFYTQALNTTNSKVITSNLLLKLGHQHSYDNNYVQTEKHFKESLKIATDLAAENRELHGRSLAIIHQSIGRMHLELNDIERAKDAYFKSLDLLQELMKINPEKHEENLANINSAIGGLYSFMGDFQRAEEAFNASLEIYARLAGEDQASFNTQLAEGHLGMGVMMARNGQYLIAESSFNKAIDIYKELSDQNPFIYEAQLASAVMSSSVMYYHWKKYAKSEEGYQKTIKIYERLVKENPIRYEPSLARTLLNLGSLYSTLSQYEDSEKAYMRSLKIRKRLAEENPQKFDPALCHTLLNTAYMKKRLLYERYDMSQINKGLDLIAETENILARYDSNLQWVKQHYHNVDIFKTYFIGITKEDIAVQNEIDKFQPLEEDIQSEPDLKVTISTFKKIVSGLNAIHENYPDNPRLTLKLSETLGTMAAYQLYDRQFTEAEISARNGLQLEPGETWINSYLALALSYQGQAKKAIKIYKELADQDYQGESLKNMFLEDLLSLENEGIMHKDNDKLKKVLEGQKE